MSLAPPISNFVVAVSQPVKSAMACQWYRAHAGDTNLRVLANGPAALKVTANEAVTYGEMFRQFFIDG